MSVRLCVCLSLCDNLNLNLQHLIQRTTLRTEAFQVRFTITAAKANHYSVSHQYEREPPSPRSTPCMEQMKMHSFMSSEMFQKCIKNASPIHVPEWTPCPYMGIHAPGYNHSPREPNWVLHGYLLHFAEGKFSRTKVCSRTMAFFRLSPNLVQKHYGNITETFI